MRNIAEESSYNAAITIYRSAQYLSMEKQKKIWARVIPPGSVTTKSLKRLKNVQNRTRMQI
jgi:hypothetical protein